MILVTHSLYFMPHVDHIVVMEEGKISAEGNFEELKKHPIFLSITAAALQEETEVKSPRKNSLDSPKKKRVQQMMGENAEFVEE